MRINKYLVVFSVTVAAACLFLLAASPKMPDDLTNLTKRDIINSSELGSRWEKMSSRFIVDIGGFDMVAPLAGIFAGIGIVFGVNYYVKRRTDGVIKRLFTHPEDKR